MARHAATALMLLVAACAADSGAADPQCIAAREHFSQIWPDVARSFSMIDVAPGNAPQEMVSGSFAAALQFHWIPDHDARQRCYETTMRSLGFSYFEPFESIDRMLTPPERLPLRPARQRGS
jgi:hypothetical protein